MKILFFGTPQIAVPFLDWLITHHTVVGVVCKPDEPVGRGYTVTAPPVKKLALEKNIPVFQPAGPWTEETISSLKKTGADIGIVVAYGRIMPETVLTAPKLGCLNIHFSLLPKYRGAAPMQWALINGDLETGVSAFWLVAEMDAGPLQVQMPVPIAPQDNLPSLREKLVWAGLEVLDVAMHEVSAGEITKDPQSGPVVMAPPLKKEMGKINWSEPAQKLSNLIRGVVEWPGAYTSYAGGKRLKILKAVTVTGGQGDAGKIVQSDKDGIAVQAGQGRLILKEVQPEGKKPMAAAAFWQGARLKIGDKFE